MNQIPRRKTIKPNKCPNPLFEQWLEEWRIEAANKNSELQYCYKNALFSLRKYPLKLNSGNECLILKNFGRQLCARLDKKLAEYRQNNPEEVSTIAQISLTAPLSPSSQKNMTKGNKRKPESPSASAIQNGVSSPQKKKPYVPGTRSGGYAILIALFQHKKSVPDGEFMQKSELIDKAQEFCDASFTKSENGNYYTAWSSMSTLIKKGLVSRVGCPVKYSLTKEGEDIASTLSCNADKLPVSLFDRNNVLSSLEDDNSSKFTSTVSSTKYLKSLYPSSSLTGNSTNLCNEDWSFSPPKLICKNTNDELAFIDLTDDDLENKFSNDPLPTSDGGTTSSSSSIPDPVCGTSDYFEQIIFVPGEFEIILLVDTRETSGKTKNAIHDDTIRVLNNLKTKFETRQLSVGDFVWIARDQTGKELLLPYIVERKRMDDLGSSIKDGRFHEQKFRLRQCGLPNVTFLIEKYGKEIGLGLPINTLHQAVVNTQLVDCFYIKITCNHTHSMNYLSVFTKKLIEFFKDKTLISCSKKNLPPFDINDDIASLITFDEFSKSSVKNKNLKIREMFIKQLVQLKGLSAEKAVAITQKYPTPRDLIAAFGKSENPGMLLSNLPYGLTNRNVGPTISKAVYKLYSEEQFE